MTDQIISILIFVAWWLFSAVDGREEAEFDSAKFRYLGTKESNCRYGYILRKYDPHKNWMLQRIFVALIFLFVLVKLDAMIWQNWLLYLSALGGSFIFWHDGFYYVRSNQWDGDYPKGFWDYSTTSPAITQKFLKTWMRVLYFIVSILAFIWTLWF